MANTPEAVMFLFVGVLAIIALRILFLIAQFVLTKLGFVVSFTRPGGFVTFGGSDKLDPVTWDRYARICRRFTQGDLFDSLWVSHHEDPAHSLVLTLQDRQVELFLAFPPAERDRIAPFRTLMAAWGHHPVDEPPGNSNERESIALVYLVPSDPEPLITLVDKILDHRQGPLEGSVFVSLSQIQDGPGVKGLKIRRPTDLLAQIP